MLDLVQVAVYLVLILLPVIIATRCTQEKSGKGPADANLPSLESMQLTPRPRPTRKSTLTRHSITTLRR